MLSVPLILVAFPLLAFIVSGNLQQSRCLSTRFRGRHFQRRNLLQPRLSVSFSILIRCWALRRDIDITIIRPSSSASRAHLPGHLLSHIALDQDVYSAIGSGLTLNVYLCIYPSPSSVARSLAPFHPSSAVFLAHFPDQYLHKKPRVYCVQYTLG